jgi:hypothetical protein
MCPDTDIGSAEASDLDSAMTEYSVDSEVTDAGEGTIEFRYQNADWSEQLGFYKNIPELKIAVDTKANWVVGNGFEADEKTTLLLDTIKGNGKDSFNSILENMERVCQFGEDAYCEIIRDKKGLLVNLKPLDTGSMVIVTDKQGRILRYEQEVKNKKPNKKFKPEEIFVLSHNRIADEVHGTSIIPALKGVILARNEAMTDWKKVLHRNVRPMLIWHMDTDDTTEIANFKTKRDAAKDDVEDIYIPKGTVVPELITTAQNATLNPLPTIEKLNDYFFQAVGVPQIIIGNAKEFTDASGKIVYLAFEQTIKGRQLYVEEQNLNQLGLKIKLTLPASLQQDTISDTTSELEEEPQEPATQPNDTKEELEGKT